MAGPSNPHRRLPTSDLSSTGIAKELDACIVQEQAGDMPDGAVIIAAITSCTNTSNPRNVVAAGLVAKRANELGLVRKPWVKSSFAPGSKVAKLYLEESGLLPEMEKLMGSRSVSWLDGGVFLLLGFGRGPLDEIFWLTE